MLEGLPGELAVTGADVGSWWRTIMTAAMGGGAVKLVEFLFRARRENAEVDDKRIDTDVKVSEQWSRLYTKVEARVSYLESALAAKHVECEEREKAMLEEIVNLRSRVNEMEIKLVQQRGPRGGT